jgi:nitroreductase / dihydropteridine reductase
MSLIETLNWRYATKRMNGQKVPQEKLDRILEAIRLAPTSAGLQPYNVLVIEDPELKKQIHPIAFNQPQIIEGSHILVFAAWEKLSKTEIDDFIAHIAAERNVDVATMDGLKTNLHKVLDRSEEFNANWMARQAYIGFGVGIVAAAEEKVDATPMEGFNGEELDKLLNLKERGLKSYAILALGYRDTTTDWLVSLKKVRTPKEKFFTHY